MLCSCLEKKLNKKIKIKIKKNPTENQELKIEIHQSDNIIFPKRPIRNLSNKPVQASAGKTVKKEYTLLRHD